MNRSARWGEARRERVTVQDRRSLAVLALIAAAVRLILILSYSPVLTTDSHSYLGVAHQIASGQLKHSAGTRTPGYPLVLLATGYSPVATWCIQAVLGVLATLLVYALARRLGAGGGIALAAALVYALDLDVLAVEHMILTETLTSFLILVAAHLALTVLEDGRPRRRWLTALGVALAYLCLVRPDQLAVALYLVLALWVALSWRLPGRRGRRLAAAARPALWVLVPPLAVLVAWAGVNRATIGVTSVSTVLGFNMIDHVGSHVRAVPGPDYPITSVYVATRRRTHAIYNVSYDALPALERGSHLNAAHLSGRLLSIAEGVIARHPLSYLGSSIKQWPRFWVPPNYADEFATGHVRGPIRLIWQLERVVVVLINLVFVLLLVADLAVRAAAGRRAAGDRRAGRDRRAAGGARGLLSGRSLLLGGIAVIGLLPASFLAYGETGRYGYVYFPIVLSVTAASAGAAWHALTARVPRRWGRSHPSRV